MGKIKKSSKVKLFFACTYNQEFNINDFYNEIEKKYGKISNYSSIIDFSVFTDYYEKEMGKNLKKQIISFKKILNIDNLHKIKIDTNEIEESYSINNKRVLNIDSGYLTEAKVILFTTKNNIHRIYIKDGIYAEITLTYRKGSYSKNPMTYADYQQNEFIHYFNKIRHELREDIDYINSRNF